MSPVFTYILHECRLAWYLFLCPCMTSIVSHNFTNCTLHSHPLPEQEKGQSGHWSQEENEILRERCVVHKKNDFDMSRNKKRTKKGTI